MKLGKVLAAILVFGMLCVCLINSTRASETKIIVYLGSEEPQIGETYQVDITVTDVDELWSWFFTLEWNTQVLNLTQLKEGDFLKNEDSTMFLSTFSSSYSGEGIVDETSCTILSEEGASGNGTLATLIFEVVGEGDHSIALSNTELNQHDPQSDTFTKSIPHTVEYKYETNPTIPEFPTTIILLLTMITVTIAGIAYKKLSHKSHNNRLQVSF